MVDGNKCDENIVETLNGDFIILLFSECIEICFLFFPALKVNLGSFTKFGNSNIPTSVDSKFMQITTQQAPTECSAQTDTFSATRLPKEKMICRLYFLAKMFDLIFTEH